MASVQRFVACLQRPSAGLWCPRVCCIKGALRQVCQDAECSRVPVYAQMPSGLMGAVIYGAAFVAAMGDVALMAGTAAVQHLRKSAASTLVMPF